MSDTPTHREMEAKLETVGAQTDVKFERMLGELKEMNARVLGHFDTLEVKMEATKKAAEEASSRTIATRWQVFFMVLGLFTAIIGVSALVLANTDAITGMVHAVVAAKGK